MKKMGDPEVIDFWNSFNWLKMGSSELVLCMQLVALARARVHLSAAGSCRGLIFGGSRVSIAELEELFEQTSGL